MKYHAYVLFGEEVSHVYQSFGVDGVIQESHLAMDIIHREFDTESELQAYINGLADQRGWEEFSLLSSDDFEKLSEQLL